MKDDLALVDEWNGGLRLIDISDPASPTEVGFLDTQDFGGVAVTGDLVLVAGRFGLRVIDISDPTSPTEVGFLDTSGAAYGVAASGDLALVADSDGGLVIVQLPAPVPGDANGDRVVNILERVP